MLLPIAQYKKDGRIVRGVQKGTTAFVKSTAMEAIKLGARLATGTQVILEQAEGVLGGQFAHPVTTETLQFAPIGDEFSGPEFDSSDDDMISKYAEQPIDIREGVQSAYKSLRRNFNSAAQTILAVPMEVYEKSGNEVNLGLSRIFVVNDTFHLGPCSLCYPRGSHCGPETYDRGKRSSKQDSPWPPEFAGPEHAT